MTPTIEQPLAGNSGIVKTSARTRVFRATRHLCAISETDNIACARAVPVTISHFEISARLQRTLFRCAAACLVFTRLSGSGYVKLAARMEAMTSLSIPSVRCVVDSSTDKMVLCLFFIRLQLDAFFVRDSVGR